MLIKHKQIQYIHEDDFIVIIKPAELRLSRLNEHQLGLIDILSDQIKHELITTFNFDHNESGLIILAKNQKAALALNKAYIDQKIKISRLQNIKNFPSTITNISFELNDKKYFYEFKVNELFKTKESELITLFKYSWSILNHLFKLENHFCYRLIHNLNMNIQADIYGSVLWVYWYKQIEISEIEFDQLEKFADSIGKKLVVRHMLDRGTGLTQVVQNTILTGKEAPLKWTAQENGIHFQLKQNSGFSPGLFLDQSENRFWVYQNSKQKKVLNLFSYTSGFSVAAALGQASKVTTVDASSSFLDWSKENFELNKIDTPQHEFFCQDVLLFLKGSLKRNRQWDLIICDPPSFGRTKQTLWKIEKDLPELALILTQCLADQGQILFTCNFEKWNLFELKKQFLKKLKPKTFKTRPLPFISVDFGLPDAETNLTKGFILERT